jgi:hypothetical protein
MKKAGTRGRCDRLHSKTIKSFNVATPSNKSKKIIGKLVSDCTRLGCGSAAIPRIKKRLTEAGSGEK